MIFRLIQFLRFRQAINREPWQKKQRVKLIRGHYQPSHSNPCVDSDYTCEGTVIDTDRSNATVRWDNGYSNSYLIGFAIRHGFGPHQRLIITNFPVKKLVLELSLNENNPNVAFKRQKEHMAVNSE